jgi:hypothetical protein
MEFKYACKKGKKFAEVEVKNSYRTLNNWKPRPESSISTENALFGNILFMGLAHACAVTQCILYSLKSVRNKTDSLTYTNVCNKLRNFAQV